MKVLVIGSGGREAVRWIRWPGAHYRTDVGQRALGRS
jgi:phosphoribosylamine-glycine ligase